MNNLVTQFSSIDELFEILDCDAYPVTVHIEARASGKIDARRLRQAVESAMELHPIARARRSASNAADKAYYWEIAEQAAIDPVQVFEAGDAESASQVRRQFLSARVPLHESPPFRLALVRCKGGDYVVLSVSHAAADGIGTLRFLRSILRAYSGEADHTGVIDPLEARNVDSLYAPDSRAKALKRFKSYAASMKAHLAKPTNLARQTATPHIASGCLHYTIHASNMTELNPKKYVDATYNDLLVAAVHRTIDVWNERHGEGSELVRVTSPVNLRPKEWWFEVFGNLAMLFVTNTSSSQRSAPHDLMKAVLDQSNLAKENGFAESMLIGLGFNAKLPIWAKNLMLQNVGEQSAASASLTNAGRISDPLMFGELGEATEVWMSPPSSMPEGMGIGITHYNGNLHIAFRYCYELLDDSAAAEFANLFHESLLWLS